jgi:hypothetical protein
MSLSDGSDVMTGEQLEKLFEAIGFTPETFIDLHLEMLAKEPDTPLGVDFDDLCTAVDEMCGAWQEPVLDIGPDEEEVAIWWAAAHLWKRRIPEDVRRKGVWHHVCEMRKQPPIPVQREPYKGYNNVQAVKHRLLMSVTFTWKGG